jgi:hypothetical protein
MGLFSTHPKTVTASGGFARDVAAGGTATGTWAAPRRRNEPRAVLCSSFDVRRSRVLPTAPTWCGCLGNADRSASNGYSRCGVLCS